MNFLHNAVLGKERPGNEQRVLEIDLILFIVAVIGKFRVSGQSKIPRFPGMIADGERPYFVGLSEGNIIKRFGGNPVIFSCHFGISYAVAAFALIEFQIFPNGLPGSRPVVSGIVIPNIYIASRLVEMIEYIAQYPSICAGLGKTIAAGIVGNDRPVFRRTKVIYPGSRSVWPFNYIFPIFIIKISIFHIVIPVLFYLVNL